MNMACNAYKRFRYNVCLFEKIRALFENAKNIREYHETLPFKPREPLRYGGNFDEIFLVF
jgi:hypothetical protein